MFVVWWFSFPKLRLWRGFRPYPEICMLWRSLRCSRDVYSWNYGESEPSYDRDANAVSLMHHNGPLTVSAHLVAMSTQATRRLNIKWLRCADLIRQTAVSPFVAGATSFRHARYLAERYRHSFIEPVNNRVSQGAVPENLNNIPPHCQSDSGIASHDADKP